MLAIDHFVLKVPDLDTAIAEYEAAGFTVTPGGTHPAFGSVNALIPFQDNSYVELIAFPGEMQAGADDTPQGKRVAEWAQREDGLVDWALVPNDIAAEIALVEAAGIEWNEPQNGQRVRPDGETVRWQYAPPMTFELPFFCADVTERSLRVPDGAARDHANGAKSVAMVTIRVRDLEQASKDYAALLQSEPEFQANTIVFGWGKVGVKTIRLIPTEGIEGPIRVQLRGWNESVPLQKA